MSEISKQALAVENSTSFPNNNTGYITPALLRGFNTDLIDSTVNQTVYTADSSSWNSKISQLNAFTASQQPSFTALNSFTSSQLNINSGYNTFTQSANLELDSLSAWTGSWNLWTSSINEIRDDGVLQGYSTRFYFNGLVSASVVQNVNGPIANVTIQQDGTKLDTGSFNTYTASTAASQSLYSASVAATFNAFSSSQNSFNVSATASISQLLGFSSSLDATFATDAQLNYSSSVLQANIDTKVNTSSFNAYTQSVTQAGYATTGSNTFIGSQTILGAASNGYNVNINVAKNSQLSGSAYNIMTQWVDATTDPTNLYCGYELKRDDANQLNYASLAVSSYTSEYPATPTGIIIGGGYTDGTNTALGFPTNQGIDAWKKFSAKKGLDVTGSLNVSGSTTITGSFQTNGGATFGNTTSQYNSINVISSLANYPGNLYNSIGFDVDNGGQYSAGMFISTYTGFGSNTAFGISGGGTGNNGDNSILQSYGNLVRIYKNTEITGSLTISGSANGVVVPLTVSSQTASMDLSKGNFFTLTLVSGSATHLTATNIKPGQTVNLLVTQSTPASGSLTFNSTFKFAAGNSYIATTTSGSQDIITFVTFNNSTIYASSINNLV